jgi:Zn-dependent protease with chaperone function
VDFVLGIFLILAFLLIVNTMFTAFASGVWRVFSKYADRSSATFKGRFIFGLRMLPVVVSLIFVLVFVIPAYLLLEPDGSGEAVSAKLAILAAVYLIGVCLAVYRVVRTGLVTRRLTANWLGEASEIEIENIQVPVYRIKHQFPVIAVIGIFRPRMFVAEQVLGSLNPEELQAAVAHEYWHLRSNDNLKRTLLRICRDLLILPLGKQLDRAWADNAESLADEYTARSAPSIALDLASALVKIARIIPADAVPSMPAGAFLIEQEGSDITSRVHHLIRLSENTHLSADPRWFGFSAPFWLSAAALAAIIIFPVADNRILVSTHDAIERFVALLQ